MLTHSDDAGKTGIRCPLMGDARRSGPRVPPSSRGGKKPTSLFSTSLLEPDVDLLDAAGNYAQDGVKESLSWGMGFATTGAVFDPP